MRLNYLHIIMSLLYISLYVGPYDFVFYHLLL